MLNYHSAVVYLPEESLDHFKGFSLVLRTYVGENLSRIDAIRLRRVLLSKRRNATTFPQQHEILLNVHLRGR
jgi:hypothetical protein